MNTIKVETGKGLQSILIDILQPIKVRIEEGANQYRSKFEFIGTVDNPIEALKGYGKSVYDCLTILYVDKNED